MINDFDELDLSLAKMERLTHGDAVAAYRSEGAQLHPDASPAELYAVRLHFRTCIDLVRAVHAATGKSLDECLQLVGRLPHDRTGTRAERRQLKRELDRLGLTLAAVELAKETARRKVGMLFGP